MVEGPPDARATAFRRKARDARARAHELREPALKAAYLEEAARWAELAEIVHTKDPGRTPRF